MKKFILLLSIVCSSLFSFSQDAYFTQYNASRTNINPAFAGIDSALVISTGYHLQWPKIDNGYKTFYFSADQHIRFLNGGIGINYLNDKEMNGAFTKNSVDFIYSYQFRITKKLSTSFGLQASYFQNKLDWNKLSFGDQIDSRTGFVYNTNEEGIFEKKSNIDFSAGLLLYTNHYYGGIAVYHLTQPDEGFQSPALLPMKTVIHAGANLSFNGEQKFILSPNVLYMKQMDFQMIMFGITAKYKTMVLGVSYRNDDAFITTVGFQNRFLKVGYSYDYTVSGLTNKTTGGSHEIQLTWFLHYQKRASKIKTLRLI